MGGGHGSSAGDVAVTLSYIPSSVHITLVPALDWFCTSAGTWSVCVLAAQHICPGGLLSILFIPPLQVLCCDPRCL